MKRFHELYAYQQEEALNLAKEELRSLIKEGFVDFGKPVSDEELADFAIFAAEDAWYIENGDKVIADIAN